VKRDERVTDKRENFDGRRGEERKRIYRWRKEGRVGNK